MRAHNKRIAAKGSQCSRRHALVLTIEDRAHPETMARALGIDWRLIVLKSRKHLLTLTRAQQCEHRVTILLRQGG
ncbi:hypothetical protein IP83_19365 [Novosphingobium sp. AAP93]|nr:hypothetical protein IP83_19365 [Novosphingobium sp. AAP93]